MARKKLVAVYLSESDLKYLDNICSLAGIEERSAQIRFTIRLLRLILPNVSYLVRGILSLMEEEQRKELFRDSK